MMNCGPERLSRRCRAKTRSILQEAKGKDYVITQSRWALVDVKIEDLPMDHKNH